MDNPNDYEPNVNTAIPPAPVFVPSQYWETANVDQLFENDDQFMSEETRVHNQQFMRERGYNLLEPIAVGGQQFDNQVWRAEYTNTVPHRIVAIKIQCIRYFRRPRIRQGQDIGELDFDMTYRDLEKEANLLRSFQHPNIMQVRELFGLPPQNRGQPLMRLYYRCLVMDEMNGTLANYQRDSARGVLSERQTLYWFRQIASAVDYIHCDLPHRWISHLAIRQANILFRSDRNNNNNTNALIFMLTDFEEAQEFSKQSRDRFPVGRNIQTTVWSSPQLVAIARRQQVRAIFRATKPMDIYSLGYSLLHSMLGTIANVNYLIANRHIAFSRNISTGNLTDRQFRTNLSRISSPMMNLCLDMIHRNPTNRPNIGKIIQQLTSFR